jgi:phage baseplate assembly protein V
MNGWAQAEIERLLANLIRVGVVAELDTAEARVRVRVGGLTTDWLPWLTGRAGATRTWSAITVGEQVLVLSPYGDPSQAVVLPSIYHDDHAAPADSADVERVVFPDGSVVEHDSATNTMTVTVAGSGNVVVNCKQATINADTSVTLNTPQTTCTGALTVEGLLTYMAGLTGSGGSGASLTGALNVTGDVANTGALTNNGKSVGSTHTHNGVVPGGGNSGVPN